MRHRRAALRLTTIVALTSACGGARAPAVADSQSQSTVRVGNHVGGQQAQMITTSNYRGLVDVLAAPPDSVWRLLPAVYGELGIDYSTLDQTGRVIGNDALRLRNRLGKVPLSRYVACGTDNGRENADSYAVTMSVRTWVLPDSASAGTTVATSVHATARSLLFNSGDVACSSTQRLEAQISELVKARAGA